MQENPIIAKTVLTVDGQKLGYLAYTQFIDDFTDSLEYALNDFQIAGINDLVLDLRYNPGGVITNARDLSSMIGPWQVVNDNSIFAKYIWNDLLTDYYVEKEGVNSANLVLKFKAQGINLDFHRIYVLVSSNTASASELIVNCLRPYMEVVLIGPESTHGKYTASITLSELNKHNWAIQPIVLKTANANGTTDYRDGFTPDYIVSDNLYASLGDPEEDMLGKAIELITGITTVTRTAVTAKKMFQGIPILSGSNRPISESQKMIWNFTIPAQ
jgi:C-terminal processing protease CtpA/Prc